MILSLFEGSSLIRSPVIEWIEMEGYCHERGKAGHERGKACVTEAHLEAFDDVGIILKGSVAIPKGKDAGSSAPAK